MHPSFPFPFFSLFLSQVEYSFVVHDIVIVYFYALSYDLFVLFTYFSGEILIIFRIFILNHTFIALEI